MYSDGDGVATCRELRPLLPALRCVLLRSLAEEDAPLAAVLAGAAGHRPEQIRGTGLADAARAAAAGQPLCAPGSRARGLDRIRSPADPDAPPARSPRTGGPRRASSSRSWRTGGSRSGRR